MAERQTIVQISIITGDSTSMYRIGEVDGGVFPGYLKEYLEDFGKEGRDAILVALAQTQYRVLDAWVGIQRNVYRQEAYANPNKAERPNLNLPSGSD